MTRKPERPTAPRCPSDSARRERPRAPPAVVPIETANGERDHRRWRKKRDHADHGGEKGTKTAGPFLNRQNWSPSWPPLTSNHRIRAIDATAQTVTFDYKDYVDGSQQKQMSVACGEFVRRLRLHILPPRFVKIRHYGLLSNRNRHTRIAEARAVLPAMPTLELPDRDQPEDRALDELGRPRCCPQCQHTVWILVSVLGPTCARAARAPPPPPDAR